jgi:hypothetical protein
MDTLLTDLFQAYYDARRNKRNTLNQLRFEMDLETNLINLYHDLRDRRYKPAPSACFIVQDSVKREVFASEFRDRVVHHLYYNYVSALFDRSFIYDSYSCRKGKGTMLGIERLEHHIRSVSRNYTREAYVLKMDIKGYFMSIDRTLLFNMVREMTEQFHMAMQTREIVDYLTEIIVKKDPLQGAKIRGNPHDWDDLPPSKCLSCSPVGVGLPIGDLTSQLFSNVFLGRLDWYVAMTLGFRHYGRYVDDFYIIDTDKERLRDAIPQIGQFLSSMKLRLNPQKVKIQPVTAPIRYLGAVVRPFYRHCFSKTMHQFMSRKDAYIFLRERNSPFSWLDVKYCLSAMNSYHGYLSHFRASRQLADICM